MSVKQRKNLFAKPVFYDHALITSIVRYGESDCIVRLFTKELGRISAFYKRGLNRKHSGAIQTCALCCVGLIASQDKLSRLVSSDPDPKIAIQNLSVKAFGYIAYVCELIERVLPEQDPESQIFELIEEVFSSLADGIIGPSILRSFELKLLKLCGYLPELPDKGNEQQIVAYDPISCCFVSKASEHTLAFSYDAIRLVKSMLIAKVGGVNYERSCELLMIGRLFQSRLKIMGVYPLKSVAFLKAINQAKNFGELS